MCYLNTSDIDYPVPISLFDLGMARKSNYSAADQERVVNKAIEVLTFVIDSVLRAEMTTRQGTLFNYLIRLLIQIPDATLHTMREILEPGGHMQYQEYIYQLGETVRATQRKEPAIPQLADIREEAEYVWRQDAASELTS